MLGVHGKLKPVLMELTGDGPELERELVDISDTHLTFITL